MEAWLIAALVVAWVLIGLMLFVLYVLIRTQRELRLYHEETKPLIEYYRTRGNLVGIHGDRPVNQVFAEIQQTLEQVAPAA